MNKIIIYPTDAGLAIIHPTNVMAVEEIALRDVPAGVPYRIIDATDVPTDRTFRAAWEADFSAPDGIGLGQEAWSAARAARGAK